MGILLIIVTFAMLIAVGLRASKPKTQHVDHLLCGFDDTISINEAVISATLNNNKLTLLSKEDDEQQGITVIDLCSKQQKTVIINIK